MQTNPSPRPSHPALGAAAVLLAMVGAVLAGATAATSLAAADDAPRVARPPGRAQVTSAPIPSTTAPPATGPETEAGGLPALRAGDEGTGVSSLQQRLAALGFWVGATDGRYGETTEQAVLAFEKAEGLPRDGVADPDVLARLAGARAPEPRSPAGSGEVVEVDLTRQLLLVVRDGRTLLALNTSTGAAATPTPPGRYRVERQVDGIRRAPLGRLYRPKYFHEGYAVHGSAEIPGQAASHGCARVSNAAMDTLWSSGLVPVGTAVWVYA